MYVLEIACDDSALGPILVIVKNLLDLTIYQVLSGNKTISTTYYGDFEENTAKKLIAIVNE